MNVVKFSILTSAIIPALLMMGPVRGAEPRPVPMMSCSSPTTSIDQGIYIVNRTCDGHRISGIGTLVDDAATNLGGFTAVLSQGLRCSYSSLSPSPGTFNVDFNCSDIPSSGGYASSISGVGKTATDAGVNVLGFAQLYVASGGYRCRSPGVYQLQGGFITDFACSFPDATGYAPRVSGIGSTSTDAAENALGFAELAASTERWCTTSSSTVKIVGLAFEVRFSCNGRSVYGFGSTLTSAGRDALMQAELL